MFLGICPPAGVVCVRCVRPWHLSPAVWGYPQQISPEQSQVWILILQRLTGHWVCIDWKLQSITEWTLRALQGWLLAGLPWDVADSPRLVTSIPGSCGSQSFVEGPWGKLPPSPPHARAVCAVRISSSSLLGPVGCCIVWVGGVNFTLWVFFSLFFFFSCLSHIVIFVQALKVSSRTRRATPLPQCGWRQKLLRKELSSSLLRGRAGWAGNSTLHS